MATKSGAGKVFSVDLAGGGRGGYGGGFTNPYAAALEREALDVARGKEERNQTMEELNLKKAKHASEQEDAAEIAMSKIATLRPDSMNFQHDYSTLMGDKNIHRAMLGGGRQAVEMMMAQKLQEHGDHIDSWNKIAQNYAYKGDISKLPTDDEGVIDWEKARPSFENALLAHESGIRSKMAAAQQQQQEAGYQQVAAVDPSTGEMTTKLVKLPETFESTAGTKPSAAQKPLPQETEEDSVDVMFPDNRRK